ncbi:MAG TPA: hypothetical protein VGB83_02490 [Actinomycetota bacterium]
MENDQVIRYGKAVQTKAGLRQEMSYWFEGSKTTDVLVWTDSGVAWVETRLRQGGETFRCKYVQPHWILRKPFEVGASWTTGNGGCTEEDGRGLATAARASTYEITGIETLGFQGERYRTLVIKRVSEPIEEPFRTTEEIVKWFSLELGVALRSTRVQESQVHKSVSEQKLVSVEWA